MRRAVLTSVSERSTVGSGCASECVERRSVRTGRSEQEKGETRVGFLSTPTKTESVNLEQIYNASVSTGERRRGEGRRRCEGRLPQVPGGASGERVPLGHLQVHQKITTSARS